MIGVLLLIAAASVEVVRIDHAVKSDPGVTLYVREVRAATPKATLPAVVMIHGARVPSVGSFDLPVPNGSLAADLALAGHVVYLMDARGYGRSTRPPEMSQPPDGRPALVRTAEVVRDIAAVVDWAAARGHDRVAVLGWATGGHWTGAYAAGTPSPHLSHVVLLNTLYGRTKGHPQFGPGSDLEDPKAPGQFNTALFGAYRFSTAASLFGPWDRSIAGDDKSAWRDPAVAAAYAEAALASDSTSNDRNPPSFRAPSGALADSFELASGTLQWDASKIRARTLVLRSERDFWSRPEDFAALQAELTHAASATFTVLADATHFAHLDRPEHGRDAVLKTVIPFLAEGGR